MVIRCLPRNCFFLWSLIVSRVFCDIPYMLARFFLGGGGGGETIVNSQAEIPITGGHLVTHLACSYGILHMGLVRTMIRLKALTLPLNFWKLHVWWWTYGIPTDNEEVPIEGAEEQPRPRGRRNVRPWDDRAQPQPQYIPMGGVTTDPFQNRVGT